MKRHIFFYLGLLSLLLLPACRTVHYNMPAPYFRDVPADQAEYGESYGQPPAAAPAGAAVYDLSRRADRQMQEGLLKAAAQTLERGLRIAPKNGLLWSQLADVRLRQGRFNQALQLAKKSNSLAGNSSSLIQRNWDIIDEIERNQ